VELDAHKKQDTPGTAGLPWAESVWGQLRGHDAADVCARSLASRDGPEAYSLRFLDRDYRIDCRECRVTATAASPSGELQLVLLSYLLHAAAVPLSGKWVTERALRGGDLFFKGPHALPVHGLLARFGGDPTAFVNSGAELGAARVDHGDAVLRLQVLPRMPMVCILWVRDEEFPPRASCLFDASADSHLPLDVILGMVKCVAAELVLASTSTPGGLPGRPGRPGRTNH